MEPEQQQNKQQQKRVICEFYIQRKKRPCKFPAMKGSKFCAAHCSDLTDKVQCPYQKGMYIDKSKLEKHLQICPRIKNRKQQEDSQWFNKGVNLQSTNKQGNQSFAKVLDVPKQKLILVIHKIIRLYGQLFQNNLVHYLVSSPEQKIQDLTNDHIQAKLIAEEAHSQGLIKSDAIYLQFGAGKGILSYAIANLVKQVCKCKSKNVLLQREARRNKFDRFMKDNPFFQRYRSDVSDFDMLTLPSIMAKTAQQKNQKLDIKKTQAEINDMSLIGVCKHMCGGALDISVRSLLRTKMNGCILASCCHHLCSTQTYLNNQFYIQNGLSQEQISIMFKISSWGTRTTWIKQQQIDLKSLENKQSNEINGNAKIIVGRIAKRLIDFGRARFLKGQLVKYCSDQITPQNFVIISSLS